MGRKVNFDAMYTAAVLIYKGTPREVVATELGVCPGTITNWSKRQEWIEFQDELREKHRQQLLTSIDAINLMPVANS